MNGKQLKNSILQWAIQGKLVPQDPNDEPASVLLERIRTEKKRLIKEGKIKKDKNESIIYRGDDNSYYEKFADGRVVCIDDDIPFEIPQSWGWARINQFAISQLGKTLDRGKQSGREYPYLCSINVYWEGINLSKLKTFLLQNEERERYRLTKGDLLVCEGGDYGRCAVWEGDTEMYYQNALHRIRFYGNLSAYFYKYTFELYRQIGYIVGQGQTIKHFTYENMKGLFFPVPPLTEQYRIVECINSVLPSIAKFGQSQDRLDKLNNEINNRLRKSILQEAIQGKLVPHDSSDEPVSELLNRIRDEKERLLKDGKIKRKDLIDSVIYKSEDNKYYETYSDADVEIELPFVFPESWAIVRLQSICALLDGEKRIGKGICLDARFLRGKSSGDYLQSGKYVSRGDNIILVDGENSGEVFSVPIDGYMGSTFKQLWISSALYEPYILEYIRFYKDELRNSKKGAAIPHLNKDVFKNLIIGIPPINEQHRIVERLNELSIYL